MRKFTSALIQYLAYLFGFKIVDQRTKKLLGKAFLIPFKGKILFIPGKHFKKDTIEYVIPEFCKLDKECFWKQEIGFSSHLEEDFENEESC